MMSQLMSTDWLKNLPVFLQNQPIQEKSIMVKYTSFKTIPLTSSILKNVPNAGLIGEASHIYNRAWKCP